VDALSMPIILVHYVYTSIFQDILKEDKDLVKALQTLYTMLGQTAYYERLQAINQIGGVVEELDFAAYFTIPSQWTGFTIVGLSVVTHVASLLIILILFRSRTKISLLGNVWMSVAQFSTTEIEPLLKDAVNMTDSEVAKVLKAS
jgi:hypothetical protein